MYDANVAIQVQYL